MDRSILVSTLGSPYVGKLPYTASTGCKFNIRTPTRYMLVP